MSSKARRMQIVQNMACFSALSWPNQIAVITGSGQSNHNSSARHKSGSRKICHYFHNFWCYIYKHFFGADKLHNCVFFFNRFFRIMRAGSEQQSGWWVGGVWRSFIIHEMGGQSVSGSDRQKLYYWVYQLLEGFLTWYLKDWDINWYSAQTRIILWRKVIGNIRALRKPQIWGERALIWLKNERGRSWWLSVLIVLTWLIVHYIFIAITQKRERQLIKQDMSVCTVQY